MAAPLNPNPEKLFQFTITPLTNIRKAFDALGDSDFNPIGLGVLQLTEKAVEFTARNVDTNVTGYLRLNTTALKDVYFNSRCEGRLFRIHFRNFFETINNADNINEDSITLSYFDGSDNIIANLGNNPAKVFNLPLFIMLSEFKSVPNVEFVCEAIILSDKLREMLDHLKSLEFNELVAIDISDDTVVICIGNGPSWACSDTSVGEIRGLIGLTRGMSTDQHHRAWFHWQHLEALRKASFIAPAVPLCILTHPKNTIMSRYTLRELGDLVFLDKAITVKLDSTLVPPGV